jgi:hypothetical protein
LKVPCVLVESVMSAVEPGKERIARQLMEAVDRLQNDIARVELWASALGGFSQAVPGYDPLKNNLHKFILPQRAAPAVRAGEPRPQEPPEGEPDGGRKTPSREV